MRLMRALLRRWRGRGRGLLARYYSRFRHALFEFEPGLFMPLELDDKIVFWCFADGARSWDPVMHLSRQLVGRDSTVFDVGANVGVWVMAAARRAGAGRVVAFEPLSRTVSRLRRNLELNGIANVRVEAIALSDRVGRAAFFAPSEDNSGLASLAARRGVDRASEVDCLTLDDYCDGNGITRIDVMKVDVEGAEELVFRGGARSLSATGAPVVMFEADDQLAAALGSSTENTKRLLAGYGYSIYRVTPNELLPVHTAEKHTGEDLLALKPVHFERWPHLLHRSPVGH